MAKIKPSFAAEHARQSVLVTAEAEAAALGSIYQDTLQAFLTNPSAMPLPRAARALFWLGRQQQMQSIARATSGAFPGMDWPDLRQGVVEGLAGAHALALHKALWDSPGHHHIYEHDMAFQIAMLLVLDWRELAAFALRNWFARHPGQAERPAVSGMAGMILAVAGSALGVPVARPVFQRNDALLARVVAHWQDDEAAIADPMLRLADRHIRHSRHAADRSRIDFDHPVEQAMSVELLMLLRLRGHREIPAWLLSHPAFHHPAATLPHAGAPAQSERCRTFLARASEALPRLRAFVDALGAQASALRRPGPGTSAWRSH
ncbi:hypothetical protein [Cupriavidus sp. IDO]|uniref:hypothetical protein n=1 Tax=Cupriavidus sp. IDO TaxID=1539142 RepID=UPI00068F9CCE|nr:hypothetical protein [Cupriavidus sp. IDO]KWR76368.1 hypothetical protein RM96_33195 [Cupriavidus sp. IDO]